jgi:type II secretory pathway component PulF
MPRFSYKAKISSGEAITGIIEAANVEEGVRKIIAQGHSPMQIVPYEGYQAPGTQAVAPPVFKGSTIPLKMLGGFTRQLFDLIDSGVSILRSLEILGRSCSHPGLKGVIAQMRLSVQSGESLSVAMGRFPSVFPVYYMHMVRSGEASGQLPEVLRRLTGFIDKDITLRAKVMGSLMYPAIVFGVGVMTFIVLLTFVMPRLTVLFEDFDTALPLATQIVISASQFMGHYGWIVLGGVVLAGYYLVRYTAAGLGREMLDTLILRTPILKDFVRNTEMTRVARTLGTLLEGGVPVAVALDAVVELTENVVIRKELAVVAREVRGGASMTRGLRKADAYWSEAAVSMISVGEETGSVEKSLFKLAGTMERETEETAAVFVTVLGPLALFFVVGVIGSMIVAMLLPLFQMNMMVN